MALYKKMKKRTWRFLNRNFHNTYLKMLHVMSLNREYRGNWLIRLARVLPALMRYPLSSEQARQHLLTITHPQSLKTDAQVEDCFKRTLALGLPTHKAREKNWDFLIAFSLILERQRPQDVVLDMGSGPASVILQWLNLYGYTHLYGCDLELKERTDGHVQYKRQNIEQTTYPDSMADVITCLSVIEHGVDMEHFLAECKRLLRPNGLLVISTDYWCDLSGFEGVEDEHGPVRLYSPQMLRENILAVAAQQGFEVVGEPDYTCGEPVVSRPNLPRLHHKYTFYAMHFVKNEG